MHMMLLAIITLTEIINPTLADSVSVLAANDTPSSSEAKQEDLGIQLYYDGRYAKALTILKKAVDSKKLTKTRTIGALQYMAYCEIALGDKQQAIKTFRRLLILKPEFRLPAGTAPKIASLFKQVKASMPKHEQRALDRPVISHVPPKVAVAGKSLILRAQAKKMPQGGQLLLRYRYGDMGQYNRIQMEAGPHKTFISTIPPALGNNAGSLEYFIYMIDAEDNKVAVAGDKNHPFRIPLTPARKKPKKVESSGISYHWWLWPVVGVVLVGTGLVVGLTLANDNTPTGSAHVHFTLGD